MVPTVNTFDPVSVVLEAAFSSLVASRTWTWWLTGLFTSAYAWGF